MDDSEIGTILYAEDDPVVRMEITDALQEAGFRVIEASTGKTAMECICTEGVSVAGLVTDINLGSGADGWAVARSGREMNPNLPVIYVTAESYDDWAARGVPNSALIAKPLVPAQLVVALSAALNAVSAAPKQADGSD